MYSSAGASGKEIAVLELSIKQARRLMIGSQLLSGPPPKRPTKRKMREVIQHLGAVQIDSISVVERSHHLVLWSRLGNHPTDWLHELHGKDRALFEYWAHACAYVPIELYGCFRRIMLGFEDRIDDRLDEWFEGNPGILDHVMEHVRQNGAVTTKSFEPPEGAERAQAWAWYGNKPTNLALDILWTSGKLMIDRREKFQRHYDLAERVYPEWDDSRMPSLDEERDTLAEITINALGVSTARWLPDYFRTHRGHNAITAKNAKETLERLIERGVAVPGRIKELDVDVAISTKALERRFKPSRTTLLSPFDNLIWHRPRTKELFDFDVNLEIYIPKAKRRYGYFSLAILHRDELVGRLDPKVDRKSGVLYIRALHLEPDFVGRDDDRFYFELAETLRDFRDFNGATEICVETADPPHAGPALRDALKD